MNFVSTVRNFLWDVFVVMVKVFSCMNFFLNYFSDKCLNLHRYDLFITRLKRQCYVFLACLCLGGVFL